MKHIKKIFLAALLIAGFSNADAQTEATYYTSKGNFKIMLTDTLTPITVDSFIARVAEKFYDGLIFHRVINNFMIQGGDPLGTGSGGPGYSFPDEFVPTLKNVEGALAMANSGPNTNGSQFFINLITNTHLNNLHTVFGKVTSGFTVVQNIGLVPTNASNKPLTDVVIDSIRITNIPPTRVQTTGRGVVVAIYPNPCRGSVNIDLPAVATKVQLINMQGQVVYSTEAKGKYSADLRHLATGLYIVRLSNESGMSQSRLVVQ